MLNRAETSDFSFVEVNNISDWNEIYLQDQVDLKQYLRKNNGDLLKERIQKDSVPYNICVEKISL